MFDKPTILFSSVFSLLTSSFSYYKIRKEVNYMKNPNFSHVLKYYRKLNNLTVPEVSNIFRERGSEIATKTIYGWESGQSQPSADCLMFLCELYHIENILETFGYQNTESEPLFLSPIEKSIVKGLREHPEYQTVILKLLDLKQN